MNVVTKATLVKMVLKEKQVNEDHHQHWMETKEMMEILDCSDDLVVQVIMEKKVRTYEF